MSESETQGRRKVVQYGRSMPVSADGTHAQPEPQAFGLGNLPVYSAEVEGEPLPQAFRVATALLAQGRSDYVLAATDRLQVVIKCYASGGENYLHTHEAEDHVFIIMDGEATFQDPDGHKTTLTKYQGILLQRGAFYKFTSSTEKPLVLLRVSATTVQPRVVDSRKWWPGEVDDRDQRIVPQVIEGQFFAAESALPGR